ncbi:RNA 3'-terminal phosphate cyclase [Verrucomicrobiaceae bacterium 227]
MLTLSGQDGGGQILRSALTLSMITGQPFRLTKIRGARPKPGLARQHLTCVKAAAQICNGAVDGAEIGSTEIIFHPGKVTGGDYQFAIGTAGSTTLLAQTLLPALWQAGKNSSLTLQGGTHNPMAPPMNFLERVYLRALKKMGVSIHSELTRFGFVPAGGGKITFTLDGGQKIQPLELLERGGEISRHIHCLCAHITGPVAEKETTALLKALNWPEDTVEVEHTENSDSSGNVLAAEIKYAHVTERASSFGEMRKPSSQVANDVARMIKNYLKSETVVGRNLADQLLLPMALAGGGAILTPAPSNHVTTNIAVIESFLPVKFQIDAQEKGNTLITLRRS